MKKLLLSALLSLGFLTLPFSSAEAATTKDQLIVDTQLNKMDYYQDGKFIKSFTVATGKAATPTPKGTFQIVNKIKIALIIQAKLKAAIHVIHLVTVGSD